MRSIRLLIFIFLSFLFIGCSAQEKPDTPKNPNAIEQQTVDKKPAKYQENTIDIEKVGTVIGKTVNGLINIGFFDLLNAD